MQLSNSSDMDYEEAPTMYVHAQVQMYSVRLKAKAGSITKEKKGPTP